MVKTITIQLPDDLAEKLEIFSQKLKKSKSYVTRKAVESLLNEYANYQIALDRLHNKNDKFISPDEMRNNFGLNN